LTKGLSSLREIVVDPYGDRIIVDVIISGKAFFRSKKLPLTALSCELLNLAANWRLGDYSECH